MSETYAKWMMRVANQDSVHIEQETSPEDCMFALDSSFHSRSRKSAGVRRQALVIDNGTAALTQDQIQSLLTFARKWNPGMPRIIILKESHASNVHIYARCLELGADSVVCDADELTRSLEVLLNTRIMSNSANGTTASATLPRNNGATARPSSSYAPLQDRWDRYHQLLRVAGGQRSLRLEQMFSHTQRMDRQVKSIPIELMAEDDADVKRSQSTIRIVHVSDTHNQHSFLTIPPGDLFAYTGDICANYGKTSVASLVGQLEDFLKWLETEVCPKFEQVVFLAGNHDVYMDRSVCRQPEQHQKAQQLLQDFLSKHPNVAYLNNSSITYRGLLIYGSPTCICRRETIGKRYISNGFERTLRERFGDWERIPNKTDILLTHIPPSNLASDLSNLADCCPILTNRVYQVQPKLHLFGHVHTQTGLYYDTDIQTLFMNGCQDRTLGVDPYGGGTPLVVDLPLDGWKETDTDAMDSD